MNNISFPVWLSFFTVLSVFLIFQTTALNFMIKPSFVPYVLWPPLIFFFLYRSFLSSFVLLFIISALSSVFLSLSIPIIFFIYLLFFIGLMLIKQFFYSKSIVFFSVLVFLFSFFCPFLIERFYGFYILSFSNILFYLYKSFITCILAILVFPILKKYFPILEGA